jgi:hypothetical protein
MPRLSDNIPTNYSTGLNIYGVAVAVSVLSSSFLFHGVIVSAEDVIVLEPESVEQVDTNEPESVEDTTEDPEITVNETISVSNPVIIETENIENQPVESDPEQELLDQQPNDENNEPIIDEDLEEEEEVTESNEDTTEEVESDQRVVDTSLEPQVVLSAYCEELTNFGGRYINFFYTNESGTPLDIAVSKLSIGDTEVMPHNDSDIQSSQLSEFGYILYHEYTDSKNPYGPISYLLEGEQTAMTLIINEPETSIWEVSINYTDSDDTSILTKHFSVVIDNEFCGSEAEQEVDVVEEDTNIAPIMKYFAVIKAPEGYIVDTSPEIDPGVDFEDIIYDESEDESQIEENQEEEVIDDPILEVIEVEDILKPAENFLMDNKQTKTFDYFFKSILRD